MFTTLMQPPGLSDGVMRRLLDCLTGLDVDYLRKNAAPELHHSGVRYEAEAPGQERWASIPWVLDLGHGDCEDLACWRTAELIVSGEAALAIFESRQTPQGRLYHILVRRADGRIEDPSKDLGM